MSIPYLLRCMRGRAASRPSITRCCAPRGDAALRRRAARRHGNAAHRTDGQSFLGFLVYGFTLAPRACAFQKIFADEPQCGGEIDLRAKRKNSDALVAVNEC